MNNNKKLYCPACGEKSTPLIDWEYSGLNDSIFNYTADFFECPYCGLVYIANITDERLSIFYAKECSYFEKSHFDISAPENIQKYKYYREIIVNAGLADTSITDVGCGRGGFLIWLKNNDWKGNCQGVDIDLKSIPNIKPNKRGVSIAFREGKATALPFANEPQALLTYFHVLEHIVNLGKVLKEAFRVLNETGYVMIEVPDGERYKDFPIGTAFWLSIREHIYHFSPSAICNALYRNGFDVVSINRNLLPTPEFFYPSLIILARKCDTKRKPDIWKNRNRKITPFVIQSKENLRAQAQKVLKFSSKFSLLTFWGCSAEFFSLLPIINLKHFTLCDSSKIKQKCNYRGIPINDPTVIQKNGALIVASYLHGDAIEKAAIKLGWPKEAIFRLR